MNEFLTYPFSYFDAEIQMSVLIFASVGSGYVKVVFIVMKGNLKSVHVAAKGQNLVFHQFTRRPEADLWAKFSLWG